MDKLSAEEARQLLALLKDNPLPAVYVYWAGGALLAAVTALFAALVRGHDNHTKAIEASHKEKVDGLEKRLADKDAETKYLREHLDKMRAAAEGVVREQRDEAKATAVMLRDTINESNSVLEAAVASDQKVLAAIQAMHADLRDMQRGAR